MIEKELGKHLPQEQREEFLRNTCDGQESVSYTRIFTPEELAEQRELLTDASIMLADIERTKKEKLAEFKDQAKPWEDQKAKAIENLRTKSEVVEEECFKVIDDERFLASKYARPYRYKNRAARTNNRTGNKKKMRQYIGR